MQPFHVLHPPQKQRSYCVSGYALTHQLIVWWGWHWISHLSLYHGGHCWGCHCKEPACNGTCLWGITWNMRGETRLETGVLLSGTARSRGCWKGETALWRKEQQEGEWLGIFHMVWSFTGLLQPLGHKQILLVLSCVVASLIKATSYQPHTEPPLLFLRHKAPFQQLKINHYLIGRQITKPVNGKDHQRQTNPFGFTETFPHRLQSLILSSTVSTKKLTALPQNSLQTL